MASHGLSNLLVCGYEVGICISRGKAPVNSSEIDKSYDKITAWRKNSFLVPCGKTGRDFIDQLTKHHNDWNNRSESQHEALKAFIVLLALGL